MAQLAGQRPWYIADLNLGDQMAFIRSLRHAALIVSGIMAAPACSVFASPASDEQPTRDHQLTVCEMISREAQREKLPEWFFARLIWQESAFNPKAVSPQGAQGIAQFMPDTARALGLANPFAPMEALQASARLLTEHLVNFGNLGLAAAAYNAGENRVQDWLSGHRALPYETIDYVLFVTGRPVFEWSEPATRHTVPPNGKQIVTDCAILAEQGAEPRPRNARLSSAQQSDKGFGVQVTRSCSRTEALGAIRLIESRCSELLSAPTLLGTG